MEDIQKSIKEIFTNFIEKKKLRKTPERFKILFEIYEHDSHFSIEEFFLYMKSKNYRVSRATLYNTVELLLESGLVKKHQFNSASNYYEKALRSSQHDHLICENCGKIIEFCDPRIHEIKSDIGELYDFNISKHEVYFYGLCDKCNITKKTNDKKYKKY